MIYLSGEDVKLILNSLDLPPARREVIEAILGGGQISDDQADELRDLCYEKLDTMGYDENYKLNVLGEKLDTLADKLLV